MGSESDRAPNKSARSARSGVRTAQSRLGTYGDLSRTEMAKARPEGAGRRPSDRDDFAGAEFRGTGFAYAASARAEAADPRARAFQRDPRRVGRRVVLRNAARRRSRGGGAIVDARASRWLRPSSRPTTCAWRSSRPPRTTRRSCPRFALRRAHSRPRLNARFRRCRRSMANAPAPPPAELWTADGRVVGDLGARSPAEARAFRDSLLRSPPAMRDSLTGERHPRRPAANRPCG